MTDANAKRGEINEQFIKYLQIFKKLPNRAVQEIDESLEDFKVRIVASKSLNRHLPKPTDVKKRMQFINKVMKHFDETFEIDFHGEKILLRLALQTRLEDTKTRAGQLNKILMEYLIEKKEIPKDPGKGENESDLDYRIRRQPYVAFISQLYRSKTNKDRHELIGKILTLLGPNAKLLYEGKLLPANEALTKRIFEHYQSKPRRIAKIISYVRVNSVMPVRGRKKTGEGLNELRLRIGAYHAYKSFLKESGSQVLAAELQKELGKDYTFTVNSKNGKIEVSHSKTSKDLFSKNFKAVTFLHLAVAQHYFSQLNDHPGDHAFFISRDADDFRETLLAYAFQQGVDLSQRVHDLKLSRSMLEPRQNQNYSQNFIHGLLGQDGISGDDRLFEILEWQGLTKDLINQPNTTVHVFDTGFTGRIMRSIQYSLLTQSGLSIDLFRKKLSVRVLLSQPEKDFSELDGYANESPLDIHRKRVDFHLNPSIEKSWNEFTTALSSNPKKALADYLRMENGKIKPQQLNLAHSFADLEKSGVLALEEVNAELKDLLTSSEVFHDFMTSYIEGKKLTGDHAPEEIEELRMRLARLHPKTVDYRLVEGVPTPIYGDPSRDENVIDSAKAKARVAEICEGMFSKK